jgi:Domain of unknown function (DUF4365)
VANKDREAGLRAQQTGNIGELMVMVQFQELGWGPIPNVFNDTGTDVLLLVRSRELAELRLVVGAQVKSGPTAFDDPVMDAGRLVGWWWYESTEDHFEDWVNFNVPHLVVLYDAERKVSHWVHVTRDAVISTGQGRKILVPADHKIDEENRQALEGVAHSGRRVVSWEGTAWDKPALSDPKEALRYALLTPRLVAPHPNANPVANMPAHVAIAMLAEARIQELGRYDLLREELGRERASWMWRFFVALRACLLDSEIAPLQEVCTQRGRGHAAPAAIAVTASWLTGEGRPDEAIALLTPELDRSRLTKVDRAWLSVQLARAFVEIGEVSDARSLASKVRAVRDRYPTDATAIALGGAASILLFNTAPLGQHDIGQVIMGADIAPMWWLTQMEYTGMAAGARKNFERWSRSETMTIGGGEPEINKLVASANIAGWLGDQASWAQQTAFVGKALLAQTTQDSATKDLTSGLRSLLVAGDEKAIAAAVRAILDDGPAAAIREEANALSLDAGTKTTTPTMLSFLQTAGDVIDETTANKTIDWVLRTIESPDDFVRRTTPSYLLLTKMLEVISGVLAAASRTRRRRVSAFFTSLDPDEILPIEAPIWSRICSQLAPDDWSARSRTKVLSKAERFDDALRPYVIASAASEEEARKRLKSEVGRGSLHALNAFGDLRRLSRSEARIVISKCAEHLAKSIDDGKRGSFGFGGHDLAEYLAVLNVGQPKEADWPALLSFLSAEVIPPEQKERALWQLASRFVRVPSDVRIQLVEVANELAKAPSSALGSLFDRRRDVWGVSTVLLATADAHTATVERLLVKLLAGSVSHRQWAARAAGELGRTVDLGLLTALSIDEQPRVRSVAAEQLARLIVKKPRDDIVREAFWRAVNDAGTLTPRFVAGALSSSAKRPRAKPSELAMAATRQLSESLSAEARGLAVQALARWS